MAGEEEESGGLLPKPCNAGHYRNEESIEMPPNQAVAGNQTEKQGRLHLKGLGPAPAFMTGAGGLGLREEGNGGATARAETPRVQGLRSPWRI